MKQLSSILIILFLIACINDPNPYHADFGSDYVILQTEELPLIKNDSLIVRIAYSGCNGEHSFVLRNRYINSSTTEIWLYKQTPDQLCDAYFEETRYFLFTDEIIEATKIVIIGPRDSRITIKE